MNFFVFKPSHLLIIGLDLAAINHWSNFPWTYSTIRFISFPFLHFLLKCHFIHILLRITFVFFYYFGPLFIWFVFCQLHTSDNFKIIARDQALVFSEIDLLISSKRRVIFKIIYKSKIGLGLHLFHYFIHDFLVVFRFVGEIGMRTCHSGDHGVARPCGIWTV